MKAKHALFIFAVLWALLGCRTEVESHAYSQFSLAFERQQEALEILRTHLETPAEAPKLLKKLRSKYSEAIHTFRATNRTLKEQLREEDHEALGKERDRIFEELNDILGRYPASVVVEVRYILQTI